MVKNYKRLSITTLFKLLALVAFTFSIQFATAQDPNLHIYLCFGQSNMSGQGTATQEDLTVNERFKVLRAANHSGQNVGEFYPAVPPLGHSESQLGPADFFGRKMVELLPNNISVAVANIAIGGQSIDLFNKATSANYIQQARNNNEWWMQYLDQYGGDAYQRIIEMGEIAKQEGVIKGILFHQGEADYNDSEWPNKVKKVYEDILNDLSLDGNEVPFLIGELATTEQGGDLGWRNEDVERTADLIPNGHLISAQDCPVLPETNYTLHFTREGYKILGERYAKKMFELLTPSGAPEIHFSSLSNNRIRFVNESYDIQFTAIDTDGSITNTNLAINGNVVSEYTSTPYTYVWSPNSDGEFTITATAFDNDGNMSSNTVTINVKSPNQTYDGAENIIPGRIEMERYDLGGEGVGYHEEDQNGNEGNASFRSDEVDVEQTQDINGDFNIGYTLAGEWLAYTLYATNTSDYSLNIRVATEGDNKQFHIELDGENITGPINVPNTGGWQIWETIVLSNISINRGIHELKVVFDTDYMNINYIEFNNLVTGHFSNNPEKPVVLPNPFGNSGFKIQNHHTRYVIFDNAGELVERGVAKLNDFVGAQLTPGVYYLKSYGTESYDMKVVKIVRE